MYKFSIEPTGTHALMLGFVRSNSKVLDIGCASGYLGEALIKDKGCEVWGIEPDPTYYQEALNKNYKFVFNTTIEDALSKIQNEEFDYILIGDVLEHVYNPESILVALNKLLKSTGQIIVSLPNVAHYSVRSSLLSGRWDMTDTGILDRTHIHFFTLKSAKELFKKTNWKIKTVRPRGDLERWSRKLGVEILGKKLLFFWPELFAIQFIFVIEK